MPEPWLGRHNRFHKDMDPRKEPLDERVAPIELTINVPVSQDDSTRIMKVGSQLNVRMKELVFFK